MSYTLNDACVRALIAEAERYGLDAVTFGVMVPAAILGEWLPQYRGVIREDVATLKAALHKSAVQSDNQNEQRL